MFAIVDCNSFYCSCERLFRPDLRTKPVVVLSNNDGCIISRSDEAKAFGVQMAGPYFLAKPLIEKHQVTVFSSNYHLYGDLSRRVMDTLRTLSASVEVYSVDEAFLDLGNIPPASLDAFALEIKERVEMWTGISVSVGIAPTKTLAKVANRLSKKNKHQTNCIKVLRSEDEIYSALSQTRITDLWGVGRAYANKLLHLGITSAWELRNMPEEWAHTHLGGVVGVRLIRELNGTPSIEMEPPLETKKMIATTRMFGRNVTKLEDLKEAVATYVSRAAEKLRRQQSAAKSICVFLVPKEEDHSAGFYQLPSHTQHTNLPAATSCTNELIKPATDLVDQLFEPGREYKKAGVMLGGLVPDSSIQANLFVPAEKNAHRFLMHALDNLNFGMQEDTVKFVRSGITRNWKMRQEMRSSRYSTRWDEMYEVH